MAESTSNCQGRRACNRYPLVSARTMPVTQANRRQAQIKERRGELVEQTAKNQLAAHPHFRGRSSTIHLKYSGGFLILTGTLPSFYLKQLLQTILRDVQGVRQIVNNVSVANPYGVSHSHEGIDERELCI